MSTSKKESGTTGQTTKKSGKGSSHGVISEVSAYMTIKPGHEEQARAGALRFGEMLKHSNWEDVQKTGLADVIKDTLDFFLSLVTSHFSSSSTTIQNAIYIV
jgi:hypothetical protein